MRAIVFGRVLATWAAIVVAAALMTGGGVVHAADASAGDTIGASGLGQTSLGSFLDVHPGCDDYGYIYSLSGVTTVSGSLGSADVPSSIAVSFSDGSSATVRSRGVSGSGATFVDGSHHQQDGVFPAAAVLTFPSSSGVIGYTSFSLVTVPCGLDAATSPTTAAPPTTEAPTTTDGPTTSLAPTVLVAVVNDSSSTTADPVPTTSETVAPLVAALAPVTAVAAQGSDGTAARPAAAAPLQLPATGSTLSRSMLTFGGGFVIIGAILVIRSRRPLDVRR